MVPASVGFQCPSCVNECRKTVRAPRTAFGGRISARPELTTIVLIVVNAFMWLLTTITGGNGSKLVDWLALTPKGTCVIQGGTQWIPSATKDTCPAIAHWVTGTTDGAPWQLLTSAFMHVELGHIALNMISLWFLGPALEAMLGRARFLIVYFVAALTGSIGVLLFADQHSPTLGASGAIFGLLGALAIASRRNPAIFQQVVVLLVINLVFSFSVAGISWQAHVGGLIGGAAVALLFLNLQKVKKLGRGPTHLP
jgi:membrane associated rhomboid family serine protease